MFKRASLRQHVTRDGVEVPRRKRQARSTATIGNTDDVESGAEQAAEFYGVLTVERSGGAPPAYVTVDSNVISASLGEVEVALTPNIKHPAMVKAADLTVLVSDQEIICIREDYGAVRVCRNENGEMTVAPIGENRRVETGEGD